MNNLRISLGKSSHTFVKLPNGIFGLGEWYDIKKPKQAVANGKTEEPKPAEPIAPDSPMEEEGPEEEINSA